MSPERINWTSLLRSVAGAGRQDGECPEAVALVRLADGDLPPRDARSLELHVSACLACAQTVEAIADSRAAGGRHLPGPVTPTLLHAAANAAERLRQALADLVTWDMPACVPVLARGAAMASPSVTDALEAYRAGRWKDAESMLSALVAEGTAPPETLHYLGACIVQQGRPAEAVAVLRQAAAARPRLGSLRLLLAEALLLCGEGEDALVELKAAGRKPGEHQERSKTLARAVQAALDASGD